jgi:hypothetical protein
MRLLCCTKQSAALWPSGLRRPRAIYLPLPPPLVSAYLWHECGLARRPCYHHFSIAGITLRISGAASRTDSNMRILPRGLRWMRLLCCTYHTAALWPQGLRRARAVILPLPPPLVSAYLWRERGLVRRPFYHHFSLAGITLRIIGAAT